MAADTTIKFDTSFDSGEFKIGIKEINKMISKLKNNLKDLKKASNSAFSSLTADSSNIGKDIGEKISKSIVKGMKSSVKKMRKMIQEEMGEITVKVNTEEGRSKGKKKKKKKSDSDSSSDPEPEPSAGAGGRRVPIRDRVRSRLSSGFDTSMDKFNDKFKTQIAYMNKAADKTKEKLSKAFDNKPGRLMIGTVGKLKTGLNSIKTTSLAQGMKNFGSSILKAKGNVGELKSSLDGVGGSLKTQGMGFKGFAGIAAAAIGSIVAAMAGITQIKEGTVMAMEVESAMDTIKFSMGESAKEFDKWARSGASAFGIATSEAYKYGSVYGNLLSVFSDSQEDLQKDTQKLMETTALISSKTGRSYEDTADRIRSGMLGSTEAIEDLGIYTQVSMIESTKAFQEFANGKSWSQLDFQTQQQVRMMAILEQATDRYGETLADTVGTRHADLIMSLNNAKLALGEAFMPIYDFVLPTLTRLAQTLGTVIEKVGKFNQALFGKKKKKEDPKSQGQGNIQQKKEIEDQGEAYTKQKEDLDEATDSMEDYGDEAIETAKKAKKASKSVQGFDILNKMSDKSDDFADTGRKKRASKPKAKAKTVEPETSVDVLKGGGFIEEAAAADKYDKAVDKLMAGLQTFYNEWGPKDIFEGFRRGWEQVKQMDIGNNIRSIGSSLGEIIEAGVEPTKKVSKAFGELGGVVAENATVISGKLVEIGSKGVADYLEKDKDKIINWYKDVAGSVEDGLVDYKAAAEGYFDIVKDVIERNQEKIASSVEETLRNSMDTSMFIGTYASDIFAASGKAANRFISENKEKIDKHFDDIYNMATDTVGTINEVWGDSIKIVSDIWEKYGEPVTDGFMTLIEDFSYLFMSIVSDVLKPIWDEVLEQIMIIWDEHLKPIFEDLGDLIGETSAKIWTFYTEKLSPIIRWFIDNALPLIGKALSGLVKIVGWVLGNILSYGGIFINAARGVVEFLSGVFTGDIDKALGGLTKIFKSVFTGLVKIVRLPINMIITMVESLVNFVIKGFNKMGEAIAEFSFDIPDWVPKLGGKSLNLGLPQIGEITLPRVPLPKLAKGGLIPPRKPRQVIVGDNMVEDEIVSPVSTMQDAMAKVLANNGGIGSAETISLLKQIKSLLEKQSSPVIEIDGREVGRAIQSDASRERKRTGIAYI